MNDIAMNETMSEIFGAGQSTGTSKDELLKGMTKLESEIKAAQKSTSKSSDEWGAYNTTITPEEANSKHRAIVFLKKDLEKMQSQFNQLAN